MTDWHGISIRVIYRVLEANLEASEKDTRKALRDAYPFGSREYHPYQVWLKEVKRAMARKFPKPLNSQLPTMELFKNTDGEK